MTDDQLQAFIGRLALQAEVLRLALVEAQKPTEPKPEQPS